METEENNRVLRRNNAAFRQVENSDDASVDNLPTLLGRVVETSTGEIERLIEELQTLRGRLQGDSDRIQTDIAKYAALSEQVMQVTKIVSDSVQKLPEAPSIGA
jgi:methyl-accepting chemotaxis protein